ncbi:hypothetical protein HK102_009664 [Quaeritorhiza haematococci]|nr:hypothetical protein HK102_009664 [Quaeritorhiza haematococci]
MSQNENPHIEQLVLTPVFYFTLWLIQSIEQKALGGIAIILDLATRPLKLYRDMATALDVADFSSTLGANSHPPFKSRLLIELISEVLTIPLFPNRISIEALTQFSMLLPFEDVLLAVASISKNPSAEQITVDHDRSLLKRIERQRFSTDTDPYVALLANVLAFGSKRIAKGGKHVLASYVETLHVLLSRMPSRYLNTFEEKTPLTAFEDDEDVDDEDDVGPKPMSLSTYDDQKPIDPRLIKWLSVMFEQPHLLTIIGSMRNSSFSEDMMDENSPFITSRHYTEISCNLLMSLISRCSGEKMGILNTLLFGTLDGSMIEHLWSTFTSCELASRVSAPRMSVEVITEPAYSSSWGVVALLSELMSRMMLTMGDDEFFDPEKRILPVAEVIQLSGMLRNIAFCLWWNEATWPQNTTLQSGSLKITYMKQLFTKLLQQLHARSARRPFVPASHWLMTSELDMESFTQMAVFEGSDAAPIPPASSSMPATSPSMSGWGGLGRVGLSSVAAASPTGPSSLKPKHARTYGPRHAILKNIPFIIPFETRVNIFREWIQMDRRMIGLDEDYLNPIARVTIRRNQVFEDGYAYLNALGPKLKNRIAITFVSEQGLVEAGIDGGGVFKEFLTTLTRQAFDVNYGLFQNTSEQLLYPSPQSYASQGKLRELKNGGAVSVGGVLIPMFDWDSHTQLKYFEFLGRILGKALYEGILVDAAFATFFLAKWLGRQSYLDDLPSLDKELYQGLIFLKNYPGDVEKDLALNFAVSQQEFGESTTIDLIPNGATVPVTNENRIRYIYLMAHYKLNVQIQRQCKAFFQGLSDLIDPRWLSMFDQQELQILLGGVSTPIDLDDLRRYTTYGGGFDANHPTIQMFWRIVQRDFDDAQRQALVKFVTSCSRPPLLGFAELRPGFCIRCAGGDEERLPTASTCVNLLKMPAYRSEETLRE